MWLSLKFLFIFFICSFFSFPSFPVFLQINKLYNTFFLYCLSIFVFPMIKRISYLGFAANLFQSSFTWFYGIWHIIRLLKKYTSFPYNHQQFYSSVWRKPNDLLEPAGLQRDLPSKENGLPSLTRFPQPMSLSLFSSSPVPSRDTRCFHTFLLLFSG